MSYVTQVVLTNTLNHFGGTLPNFIQRQKMNCWAKFSIRLSIGVLLFHNGDEYGKSKTFLSRVRCDTVSMIGGYIPMANWPHWL